MREGGGGGGGGLGCRGGGYACSQSVTEIERFHEREGETEAEGGECRAEMGTEH